MHEHTEAGVLEPLAYVRAGGNRIPGRADGARSGDHLRVGGMEDPPGTEALFEIGL